MTIGMLVWHLVGAWFTLVAIGAAWFQGFSSGKQMGEALGYDRGRKLFAPTRRDYGEQ